MNVLEYALNSAAYLFFVGFIFVAINGFAVGGATAGNVLLMLAGTLGTASYGYTLLTNPVNWYEDVF